MNHVNEEHKVSCSLYFNLYYFLKTEGVEFGEDEARNKKRTLHPSRTYKEQISMNSFEKGLPFSPSAG